MTRAGTVAAWLALLAACSSDSDANDGSSAGGAGAGAGSNASGAGSNASGAGSSASGGSSAGASAAGGGGAASDVSLDDVDLGLGGLNQDLPAPSVDCLDMDVSIGCFAVSGEYNGEPFEIVCDDDRHILNGLGGVNGHYIEGCYNTEVNGERFDVEVLLAASLIIRPPSTFSADAASADAFFNLFRPDRELHPYVNRGFTMYQLGESHDLAFRLAGISHLFERPLLPGSTQPEYEWHVEGAFALSLTPKSGCVPNAMGFGCDDIRLRGHFNATPAKDPPGTP